MKKPVDLYDSHYGNVAAEVYRAVRNEAFGEDLAQTSWITAEECEAFCRWLGLEPGQRLLEVACGSGGTAVHMAARFGVSVVGIDVNEAAVNAATARAEAHDVKDRVAFHEADADDQLPFPDGSFDVLFCNDAINHLRDRTRVLADWHRLLRPGGRCLYTDPIVVTGCLSNAEIEKRSSIGFFLFTPRGFNEAAIRAAGFHLELTADATPSVSRTSKRWYEARKKRKDALCDLEGETGFADLQDFLGTVHTLSTEHRLSRLAFLCRKP